MNNGKSLFQSRTVLSLVSTNRLATTDVVFSNVSLHCGLLMMCRWAPVLDERPSKAPGVRWWIDEPGSDVNQVYHA